jgi:uncharacterized membrane protein
MNTYLWLKLVHVVSAIVAVGSNVTYFVWLARLRKDSAAEPHISRGVRTVDARLANPAYVVLPVTGVLMVLDADLGFTMFWIAAAIILYIAMGVIAGVLFGPALRSQVALAEAGDAGTVAYAEAVRRTTITGIVTMVPIAVIVYLMVLKPTP